MDESTPEGVVLKGHTISIPSTYRDKPHSVASVRLHAYTLVPKGFVETLIAALERAKDHQGDYVINPYVEWQVNVPGIPGLPVIGNTMLVPDEPEIMDAVCDHFGLLPVDLISTRK